MKGCWEEEKNLLGLNTSDCLLEEYILAITMRILPSKSIARVQVVGGKIDRYQYPLRARVGILQSARILQILTLKKSPHILKKYCKKFHPPS